MNGTAVDNVNNINDVNDDSFDDEDIKIDHTLNLECYDISTNEQYKYYCVGALPLYKILDMSYVYQYDAQNNDGEQRGLNTTHLKNLKKAILSNSFTPSPITLFVEDNQFTIKGSMATLHFDKDEPFRVIDGGHRLAAFESIAHKDVKLSRRIKSMQLPVIFVLGGSPRDNFINLQMGKAVDRSQLLSMKVQSNGFTGETKRHYDWAHEACSLLHNSSNSPLFGVFKFDSSSDGVGFNAVARNSSSDNITTFLGASKLAKHYGLSPKDYVKFLVEVYMLCYKANLMTQGKILCLPPTGKVVSMNVFIGVVNVLLFMKQNNMEINSDTTKDILKTHLNDITNLSNKFSATGRREFFKVLCGDLFKDSNLPSYEGIPESFLNIFSGSSVAIKMPKETKNKKKEKTEKTEETK